MQLWLLNLRYRLLFSFWQISFSFLGTSFCLLYLPCYFLGPVSHRTALGIPCKRIYSVTPKKNQSDTFSIVQKEEIPVSFREGSRLDYLLNLFQTEWQNWKRTKDILFTSNGNTRKNDWCSSSCHMELQCTQTQIWEFTTMLLWPAFRVGDKLQVNSVDDFIPVSNTTILLLTFKCIPFFLTQWIVPSSIQQFMSLKIRMCYVFPMRSNYSNISEQEQAFELNFSDSQQQFFPLLPVYVRLTVWKK